MIVKGGGETGAIFVKDSPIPRELYQTDWTTDNAIRYIDSLDDEEDWFVWASYGDPHHAYDPPVEEDYINWKDIAPYDAFGESDEQRMAWLEGKPWHWKEWYTGDTFISFEALEGYHYRDQLKSDHIREIHQKIYTSNKLIDDVYLPLIGDNLAKQIGVSGEAKRTDRMGLLLLISLQNYLGAIAETCTNPDLPQANSAGVVDDIDTCYRAASYQCIGRHEQTLSVANDESELDEHARVQVELAWREFDTNRKGIARAVGKREYRELCRRDSGGIREDKRGLEFADPCRDVDEIASRLIFRERAGMVRAAWVRGRRLEGPEQA